MLLLQVDIPIPIKAEINTDFLNNCMLLKSIAPMSIHLLYLHTLSHL